MLNRETISTLLTDWLVAWNGHDLEGVLAWVTDDVVFEHWNGHILRGRHQLRRVWQPWFSAHGDFHFEVKDLCIDTTQQSFGFEWRLTWPSPEPEYIGRRETREGTDLIKLRDGKVSSKRTYIRTALIIDGLPILLKARTPIQI